MKRRAFLALMSSLAAAGGFPAQAATSEPRATTSNQTPRKVIVGTVMQAFWGDHPGLGARLDQLTGMIDQMSVQARSHYGRDLDLAVLPEASISGEANPDVLTRSIRWEGQVYEAFARKAREHHCYIVVPTYLRETRGENVCSNAAILVDRKGDLMGIYRKVHLVVSVERGTMENGATPGRELPVFDCDFGKLGIQICYDMDFDDGWAGLARRGAELIAWPTQSPQTSQPAFRAKQGRCYIVSSTWRDNASIFEPTGKIAAQIKSPDRTLVQELDLSYALLPWSLKLQNGRALQKAYRENVGYHYYEDEDCGIFWSNDRTMSIGQMVRSLGVLEMEEELARVKEFYRRAGIPDFREESRGNLGPGED